MQAAQRSGRYRTLPQHPPCGELQRSRSRQRFRGHADVRRGRSCPVLPALMCGVPLQAARVFGTATGHKMGALPFAMASTRRVRIQRRIWAWKRTRRPRREHGSTGPGPISRYHPGDANVSKPQLPAIPRGPRCRSSPPNHREATTGLGDHPARCPPIAGGPHIVPVLLGSPAFVSRDYRVASLCVGGSMIRLVGPL